MAEFSIQRYKIPSGIRARIYALVPDEEGDWVSYQDLCKAMQTIMAVANNESPSKSIHCEAKIEIPGTKGIAVTYCTKMLGHRGSHGYDESK